MANFREHVQQLGLAKAVEIWRDIVTPEILGQYDFQQLLEVCKCGCSDARLKAVNALCTCATSFSQWHEVIGVLPKTSVSYGAVLQQMARSAQSFEDCLHLYGSAPRGASYEVSALQRMRALATTFTQWRDLYKIACDHPNCKCEKAAEAKMAEIGTADDWLGTMREISSSSPLYAVALARLDGMELPEEKWLNVCEQQSLGSQLFELAAKKLRGFK
jgi:hypothetical protein